MLSSTDPTKAIADLDCIQKRLSLYCPMNPVYIPNPLHALVTIVNKFRSVREAMEGNIWK